MRSLFKLSLAALLALIVAGTAFAADVKWSGNIGAGFGQISYGKNDNTAADAYSEYVTSYEANIRATVEAGPVTAVWRLRSRGHQSGTTGSTESGASAVSGTASSSSSSTCTLGGSDAGGDALNTGTCTAATTTSTTSSLGGLSYAEIWWKPADAVTIGIGRFQGQTWSQPMSGTYLILNPTAATSTWSALNGAPEYFMNWTGIDGIDFEFNAGVAQIGLAIASECRPSCTGGTKSPQSMVPHVTAKFGDIGVRAQLPQTSGKDSADESHTGSGIQLGVSWSGMQGVYVGFDYQTFTNKEVGGGEDETINAMGLRVDVMGIQLGYWSGKLTNSGGVDGAEKTGTWIKLAYFLKVSDNASIIPEYTTVTGNPASDAAGKDITNNTIRLVGNVTF
jgi:hypothetical protein